MAGKIKFFCTRCRRLVQFSADRIGTVASCPFCNQSLIIPNITDSTSEDSEPDNLRAPESVENKIFDQTLTDNVLSEKIDLKSWSNPLTTRGEGTDDDLPGDLPPVINDSFNDDFNKNFDFKDNNKDEAPPVIGSSEYYASLDTDPPTEKKSHFSSFLAFFFLVVAVAVTIFIVNNFLFQNAKNDPAQSDKVAADQKKVTILVDGRIMNIGDNDKPQEEAGSFIFMFPENSSKFSPLTTTGLTLNNTHPVDIKNFKGKISERGGLFMISDSSGSFDGKLTRGGKYKILIISSKVLQKKNEDHTAEFAQIGKYLFNPSDPLLRDYAFVWTERTITENHFLLDHNFGRVSGSIFTK